MAQVAPLRDPRIFTRDQLFRLLHFQAFFIDIYY